jgi:hypothetical protein
VILLRGKRKSRKESTDLLFACTKYESGVILLWEDKLKSATVQYFCTDLRRCFYYWDVDHYVIRRSGQHPNNKSIIDMPWFTHPEDT